MREDEAQITVCLATESDCEALAVLLNGLADEQLDDIGIVLDTKPVLPD